MVNYLKLLGANNSGDRGSSSATRPRGSSGMLAPQLRSRAGQCSRGLRGADRAWVAAGHRPVLRAISSIGEHMERKDEPRHPVRGWNSSCRMGLLRTILADLILVNEDLDSRRVFDEGAERATRSLVGVTHGLTRFERAQPRRELFRCRVADLVSASLVHLASTEITRSPCYRGAWRGQPRRPSKIRSPRSWTSASCSAPGGPAGEHGG